MLSTPSWKGLEHRRRHYLSELLQQEHPSQIEIGAHLALSTLCSTVSSSETLGDKLPPGLYKVSFQLLPPLDTEEAQAEFRLLTLIRFVLSRESFPYDPRPPTDQYLVLLQRLTGL